jgi:hypothetical protein
MACSKLTCPKWHFGKVEHGDNWDISWSNFLVKKTVFSYSVMRFQSDDPILDGQCFVFFLVVVYCSHVSSCYYANSYC